VLQPNRPTEEGPVHPGSITSSTQIPKRSSPVVSPHSSLLDLQADPPWPQAEAPVIESVSATPRPPSLQPDTSPSNHPWSPPGGFANASQSAQFDDKPGVTTPGSHPIGGRISRPTDSGDHLNAVLLGHTHSQIRLRWPAGRSPRNLLV
jgi:hypothetical protein